MNVNGTPEDRPLRLGDLANTESPEMVRAALGRFRRRLLIRGLIALLAVGAAFVLYPRYFSDTKELTQEIRDARGEILLRRIDGGELDVFVFKVARLSKQTPIGPAERFGIYMVVSDERLGSGEQIVVAPVRSEGVLQIQNGVGNPNIQGLEVWVAVSAGTRLIDLSFASISTDGSAVVLTRSSLGTLRLDMEGLNVPDWIWR